MYTKDSEGARKVRRVAATMAVENMAISQEMAEKLLAVSRGEMTTDDIRAELRKKYE